MFNRIDKKLWIAAWILRRNKNCQFQFLRGRFPHGKRKNHGLQIKFCLVTALGTFFHEYRAICEQLCDRLLGLPRDTPVIFQRDLRMQARQMLDLNCAFICLQHPDTSRHSTVQKCWKLGKVNRAVLNFKIKNLTDAFRTDGQRQRDGDIRARTESL